MKQVVNYSVKDKNGYLIDLFKEFPDEASACSFFIEIKTRSITTPIISDKSTERKIFEPRI